MENVRVTWCQLVVVQSSSVTVTSALVGLTVSSKDGSWIVWVAAVPPEGTRTLTLAELPVPGSLLLHDPA